MSKLYYSLLILLSLIPFGVKAEGQNWYFPIQGYEIREQYKTFDQYWDKNSYKGKEALFPTQFTGYHVADDLEIKKGEENQNVPIYAVSNGKITLAGAVSGYGGLVLLNIANDTHTALYGHMKLNSLKVKAGDSVKAGQELGYLGNGFSNETGGERKHLHFGIYYGKGVYYRGYESSEQTVKSKWIDPGAYLKEKGAKEVGSQPLAAGSQKENSNQNIGVNNENINAGQNISQLDITNQAGQGTSVQNESKSLMSSLIEYLKNILDAVRSRI